MKTIGEYLREKRLEAGLSIRALSIAAGISHVYLSHLEQGIKSNPALDVIARLLKALDADWEDFLTATGYMKPRKKGNARKRTYDLAEDPDVPPHAQEKPGRYKSR